MFMILVGCYVLKFLVSASLEDAAEMISSYSAISIMYFFLHQSHWH